MHQDMLDLVFLSRKGSTTADSTPTSAAMAGEKATPAQSACPVDHKARETWLSQDRATKQGGGGSDRQARTSSADTQAPTSSSSWAWGIPFFSKPSPQSPLTPAASSPAPHQPSGRSAALETDRVVSSIPRSSSPGASSCPVNHEVETGADAASGNWIYPSEKMFFDAMKRKGFDNTRVADMTTVVPIHNAVNEKAWAEIRAWEAPYTGQGKGQ